MNFLIKKNTWQIFRINLFKNKYLRPHEFYYWEADKL